MDAAQKVMHRKIEVPVPLDDLYNEYLKIKNWFELKHDFNRAATNRGHSIRSWSGLESDVYTQKVYETFCNVEDSELFTETFKFVKQFSNQVGMIAYHKIYPAGGVPWHTHEAKWKIIHVPLITNMHDYSEVMFENRIIRQNYQVGECWEFGSQLPHRSLNMGRTERIHLVFEIK